MNNLREIGEHVSAYSDTILTLKALDLICKLDGIWERGVTVTQRTLAYQNAANALKIPNKHRGSLRQLYRVVNRTAKIARRAFCIKNEGIVPGCSVMLSDGTVREVKTIAVDFTLRLAGRRGAFDPFSLDVVQA